MRERILEVIERDIKPYLEMDGGSISLVNVYEGVVYVELTGACETCPSSNMTLKRGVEAILKRKVSGIRAVKLAGLDSTFASD
ncbi:MAG: NifU family protein [Chlorobi bacterium]|nr:NifU family protein [Chlorobiota bacterium]